MAWSGESITTPPRSKMTARKDMSPRLYHELRLRSAAPRCALANGPLGSQQACGFARLRRAARDVASGRARSERPLRGFARLRLAARDVASGRARSERPLRDFARLRPAASRPPATARLNSGHCTADATGM